MALFAMTTNVGIIMESRVIKDPRAESIRDREEIEKKVDYILSAANKPLVLNLNDFLRVKDAFINRVRVNRNDENLINRVIELSRRGGRKTRRRSRKYKKYKK
jgi:hypothetical protein